MEYREVAGVLKIELLDEMIGRIHKDDIQHDVVHHVVSLAEKETGVAGFSENASDITERARPRVVAEPVAVVAALLQDVDECRKFVPFPGFTVCDSPVGCGHHGLERQ